ncbi:unnamed protein product, partial [Effrenium voratum]
EGFQFVTKITNVAVDPEVLQISVVVVLVVLVLFVVCVRTGLIGPKSLQPADLKALKTFSDSYRISQLELEEDVLAHEMESFWYIGQRYITLSPVEDWNELYPSALRGVFIDLAKNIDHAMLGFQYRVWTAKGKFSVHFPVMLVAQEWRRWAMRDLQHFTTPTPELKDALIRRSELIEHMRDLSMNGVATLRDTPCWDETDDLSLLVVLRAQVAKELRSYVQNWELLEMQQTFVSAATDSVEYLVQLSRCSASFLQKIFCTDELKLKTRDETRKVWDPIARGVQELESWAGLWNEDFPHSFFDHFCDEFNSPEMFEDLQKQFDDSARPTDFFTVAKHPDDMNPDEKEQVASFMRSYWASSYGLTQPELTQMMRHAVVLTEQSYILLDVILLMMSLENFASLGGYGSMFLSGIIKLEHAQNVLSFCEDTATRSEFIVAPRDFCQTGFAGNVQLWELSRPVGNAGAEA